MVTPPSVALLHCSPSRSHHQSGLKKTKVFIIVLDKLGTLDVFSLPVSSSAHLRVSCEAKISNDELLIVIAISD